MVSDGGDGGPGNFDEDIEEAWDLLDQEKEEFVEAVERGDSELEIHAEELLEELERLLNQRLGGDSVNYLQNSANKLEESIYDIYSYIHSEGDIDLENIEEKWEDLVEDLERKRTNAESGEIIDKDYESEIEALVRAISVLVPGGTENRRNLREDLQQIQRYAQRTIDLHKKVIELEKIFVQLMRSVKMQEQLTDTEKGQRILEAIAESDEEVEEIKEEMQTIEGKMERLREEIDEIRDAENYVIEQLKRAAKIISELDSIEDDLVGRIWNEYEEAQRNLGFINRSNENKADDREKVRSYESAIKALKELRNIVAEAESAEERNERPEFRLAEQLEDYIQTEESLFQRERKFNFEDVHPLVPLEKIDTQNVMYPKGSSVFKKALVQAIEDHNSKDNALREIRRAKEDFKSDYKKEEGTEAAIHDFEDRVDKLVRDMERTKEAYVGMLTGSGLGINKGKKDIDEIKGSDKDSNDEFSNLEYGNDEIPGLKTVLEELKEIRDDLSRILGEENEIKKEWGEARGELQEAKERAKEEIEDIERIERMEVAFTTENQDQLFNDKILLPKNPQRTQEGREIYQRALAAAANELGVSSGNLGNEIQYLLQYRDRLEEELEEAEEIEEKDFEIEEEQKEEIKEAAEELYNKIEIFWDLMKNHAGEGQVLPSEINEDRNDIVEVIKDIENLIERDII